MAPPRLLLHRGPGRAPALAALLSALGLALGAAGCVAPTSGGYGSGYRSSGSSSTAASRPLPRPTPAWRFQPLSWGKLETVEAWLSSEGRHAPGDQRIEAELVLAEGRATYAREDLSRGRAADLEERLGKAQSGFERVLRDPRARSDHRQRAQRGLSSLGSLQSTPTATGPVARASRSAWNAAPANPARLTRSRGGWNRTTIHHSAEYAGLLRGKGVGETARVLRNIQRYHMQQKGYGDIAYHFLIDPSGRVFEGRSLTWQGAHAGGNNNVGNIGICLLGDFEREAPTRAALASLTNLTRTLGGQHAIAAGNVVGHGELKTTACPGRHLRTWLRRFRAATSSSAIAAR